MRSTAAVIAGLVLAAAPAAAAKGPAVTVSPTTVGFGDELEIKGSGWAVFELCEREVILKIKSDQNAFRIGTADISGRGRFKSSYKIRRSVIGSGDWRLQATQICESGEDGSPNPIRRSASFTIR